MIKIKYNSNIISGFEPTEFLHELESKKAENKTAHNKGRRYKGNKQTNTFSKKRSKN